jgi:hypothetical protein
MSAAVPSVTALSVWHAAECRRTFSRRSVCMACSRVQLYLQSPLCLYGMQQTSAVPSVAALSLWHAAECSRTFSHRSVCMACSRVQLYLQSPLCLYGMQQSAAVPSVAALSLWHAAECSRTFSHRSVFMACSRKLYILFCIWNGGDFFYVEVEVIQEMFQWVPHLYNLVVVPVKLHSSYPVTYCTVECDGAALTLACLCFLLYVLMYKSL